MHTGGLCSSHEAGCLQKPGRRTSGSWWQNSAFDFLVTVGIIVLFYQLVLKSTWLMGEMAQWVKKLSAKRDDRSSVSGTHVV